MCCALTVRRDGDRELEWEKNREREKDTVREKNVGSKISKCRDHERGILEHAGASMDNSCKCTR